MTTADNLAIKIPETHYVGFQKRSGDEVPLGFMTPDGTDKAATKRKATVDSWANGYGYSSQKQATLESKTLENKPMVGFKIAKLVAGGGRGWDARSDAWRIEDPRGFELEIGSGNFQEILAVTTVERGEILEECIWGRLGNNNILIPVTSDVYTRAVANTERMGKKSTIREAKPGYHLIFQNGDEATYMGKTFASGYTRESVQKDLNPSSSRSYQHAAHYYENVRINKAFNDKPIHTYILLDKTGKPSRIMMRDSLKLSEVREGPELTQAEACDKLNDLLSGKVSADIPNKYDATRVFQFAPEYVENFPYEMELREIGDAKTIEDIIRNRKNPYEDDDEELGYQCDYTPNSFVIKSNITGQYTTVNVSFYPQHHPTLTVGNLSLHYAYILDTDALEKEGRMVKVVVEKDVEVSSWSFGSKTLQRMRVVEQIDRELHKNASDFTFYKLIGKTTTFSGKPVYTDHSYYG